MSDTSDVGMMYRGELERRGVPMTNENLSRLIMESRRNPGVIPGLTVQGEDLGPNGPPGGPTAAARSPLPLPVPPIPPDAPPMVSQAPSANPSQARPSSINSGTGVPDGVLSPDGSASVPSPSTMASVINSTQTSAADMLNGLGIDPTGALAALILGGGAGGSAAMLNKFRPVPATPRVDAPAPPTIRTTPTGPAPTARAGMPMDQGTVLRNLPEPPAPTPVPVGQGTGPQPPLTPGGDQGRGEAYDPMSRNAPKWNAEAEDPMQKPQAKAPERPGRPSGNEGEDQFRFAETDTRGTRPYVEAQDPMVRNLSPQEQSVWTKAFQQFRKLGHDEPEARKYAEAALEKARARSPSARGGGTSRTPGRVKTR